MALAPNNLDYLTSVPWELEHLEIFSAISEKRHSKSQTVSFAVGLNVMNVEGRSRVLHVFNVKEKLLRSLAALAPISLKRPCEKNAQNWPGHGRHAYKPNWKLWRRVQITKTWTDFRMLDKLQHLQNI